jgi:hypothetical protein
MARGPTSAAKPSDAVACSLAPPISPWRGAVARLPVVIAGGFTLWRGGVGRAGYLASRRRPHCRRLPRQRLKPPARTTESLATKDGAGAGFRAGKASTATARGPTSAAKPSDAVACSLAPPISPSRGGVARLPVVVAGGFTLWRGGVDRAGYLASRGRPHCRRLPRQRLKPPARTTESLAAEGGAAAASAQARLQLQRREADIGGETERRSRVQPRPADLSLARWRGEASRGCSRRVHPLARGRRPPRDPPRARPRLFLRTGGSEGGRSRRCRAQASRWKARFHGPAGGRAEARVVRPALE